MTIEEINDLVSKQQDQQLQQLQQTAKQQLNIADHDVNNVTLRPNKQIIEDTGDFNDLGEPVTRTKIEPVNRIAVPFQKLIVKRRLAFMNVKSIALNASAEEDETSQRLIDFVEAIREDNKLQYQETIVAKKMLEDLQSAKLYYFEETEKNNYPKYNSGSSKLRMRMRVLAPSLGDTLIPIFDEYGSMVMFVRQYQDVDLKNVMEVFTDSEINTYVDNVLIDERSGANPFGKIPIVYYSLNETIWGDVQPMINRFETLVSNFADTVDYNGSPILKAIGNIQGFSARGERGKVFQMDPGASLDYVSWDSAPEAIKLEQDTLRSLIFTCSQTPDISFDQMKGLGGLTGVGMDRVFVDAQLAAADIIDGGYGESTQRDINIQIAGAVFIDSSLESVRDLEIGFTLEPYKFDDVSGAVDNLIKAYSGGVLSQKTAVLSNPLNKSGISEYDQIKDEGDSLTIREAEEEVYL